MIYLDNRINIFTTKGLLRPNQLHSNIILKNYQNKIQIIEETVLEKVKGKTVVFKNGESFFLASENSLLTFEGISKISNLKVGDFASFKSSSAFSPSSNKDVGWVDDLMKHAVPIKVPEKISPKLSYWLGIYCARGFVDVSSNIIYINTQYNKGLSEIVVKITKDLFDLTPDVITKDGNEHIVIYSANLVRFIKSQVGTKIKFKKIPTIIQNSSIEEQFNFFLGISYKAYQEKSKIVFSFNSTLFTNFLTSLLKNLGFIISKKTTKSKTSTIHYTNIIGRTRDIDFCDQDIKPNPVINYSKIKRNYLVKPPNLMNVKVKYDNPSASSLKRLRINKSKLVACYVLDGLGIEFNSDIYYNEIVDIKDDTKETTAITLRNPGGVVIENLILFE